MRRFLHAMCVTSHREIPSETQSTRKERTSLSLLHKSCFDVRVFGNFRSQWEHKKFESYTETHLNFI